MREIDIASDAGRAEVLALARDADVMVDNYRPGVLRRHGLGYDDVQGRQSAHRLLRDLGLRLQRSRRARRTAPTTT